MMKTAIPNGITHGFFTGSGFYGAIIFLFELSYYLIYKDNIS